MHKLFAFSTILGSFLVSACASAGGPPALPPSTDLFVSGQDGYAGFRIPALCRLPDGTLLAFAEGRKHSLADHGDIDVVMRRSADGGRTWEPMRVLADDGDAYLGNVSPLVDRRDGSVSLLMAWKAPGAVEAKVRSGQMPPAQIWLSRSEDGGRNWTKAAPAPGLEKLADERGWRWNLPSACHGIQLEHGPHAGRMVAAGNHSAPGGAGDKYLGAHALLSDDGGRTWRVGAADVAPAAGRQGEVVYPNESTVAELPDGSLLFHTRDHNGPAAGNRGMARSLDGGETFAQPFAPEPGVVGPICQGALLSGTTAAGKPVLLASLPGDPKKRQDLLIRISEDGGKTWSRGPLLHAGPAAYSDLAMLAPGQFVVMAELDNYRRIVLIPFSIP